MTKDFEDISTLSTGEREIQINRPGSASGEKLPIWVQLMSTDDKRMKTHIRAVMDKQADRARRNKVISTEEKEKYAIELLARTIVGWKWEALYKGEIPEFSHRKAIEILSDENIPWFFAQINEEAGDTDRFFQA